MPFFNKKKIGLKKLLTVSIIMFDAVCSLWPLQRRLMTIVLTENCHSCCSSRGFATPVALILRRRFVTSSLSTKNMFHLWWQVTRKRKQWADKLLIYKYFLIYWELTHTDAFTLRDKLLIDLARKSRWVNNARLQWWNVMLCNFTIYYLTMLSKICLSWHKKATFIK